jgi:hypothetical protein
MVSVTETRTVYCAVRTASLNVGELEFSVKGVNLHIDIWLVLNKKRYEHSGGPF